jgi:hypothetical protein
VADQELLHHPYTTGSGLGLVGEDVAHCIDGAPGRKVSVIAAQAGRMDGAMPKRPFVQETS